MRLPWLSHRAKQERARAKWLKEASRDDQHRALPIHEAWAIALTWQEQLQSCVRISTSAHEGGPARVVESYSWVNLSFPGGKGTALRQAQAARAATIAWVTLSSCCGYSAQEAPEFWRQVFDVLLREQGDAPTVRAPLPKHVVCCYRSPLSFERMSGAIDFFANSSFPRVSPRFGRDDNEDERRAAYQLFFLGEQASIEGATTTGEHPLLASILERLRPLVIPSRTQRSVEVQLPAYYIPAEDAQGVDHFLTSLHPDQTDRPQANALITRFVVTELCHVDLPSHSVALPVPSNPLVLDTIPSRRRMFEVSLDLLQFQPRAFNQPVSVASVETSRFGDDDLSEPRAVAKEVATILQTPGHHSSIVVSSVCTYYPRAIPILCSALPFTRTLESIKLDPSCDPSSTQEAAWLGYALFHPDAASSSWKSLTMDQFSLSGSGMEALRSMAEGNNLLPALTGEPVTPSTAYLSTRLVEGTFIFSAPSSMSDVLWIVTEERERQVDLCVPGDWDLSSADYMICVVARGWGHGWVQKSAVGDVTSRPPSKCMLTSLRLVEYDTSRWFGRMRSKPPISPDTLECLVEIMPLIGRELRMLDMAKFTAVSKVAVRSILEHCPLLTGLGVHCARHLWSNYTQQDADLPCRLRELWMRLDNSSGGDLELPCSAVRSTIFSKLARLRVEAHCASSLRKDSKVLTAILQCVPTLRSIHYDYADFHAKGGPSYYAVINNESWDRMGLTRNDQGAFAEGGTFSVEGRIAFCSASKKLGATGSAIGRIDQHVAQNIFSFASSRVLRELWIAN